MGFPHWTLSADAGVRNHAAMRLVATITVAICATYRLTIKARLHFAAGYTVRCTTGWTKRFEYSYDN